MRPVKLTTKVFGMVLVSHHIANIWPKRKN